MGSTSKIEWTDSTWTPIRARNKATGKVGWHCEHSTTGCEFCYSESINLRLGTGLPFKPGHRKDVELFLDEAMLMAPLKWRKPRMVFVCSMTDLFADFVYRELIDGKVRNWLGEGGINWTIVGGESGRNARPMHPDWVRSLRDQHIGTGAAFFFKQHGQHIGHSAVTWDHQGAHTSQTFGKPSFEAHG